jgi:hypothetical protein
MICRALWVCKMFLYGRLTLILETKHRTRYKASSSATLRISSSRDLGKLDVVSARCRYRIVSSVLLVRIPALNEHAISCATIGMANRNGLPNGGKATSKPSGPRLFQSLN